MRYDTIMHILWMSKSLGSCTFGPFKRTPSPRVNDSMTNTPRQVAVWMSSVHACIERLIRHYAIRKARLHPTTPPVPPSPCNRFPRSPQQRGHCAPSLLHPLPVSYPQGEHLAPSSPLLPLDPISPHTLWELSIPKVSPHYPTRTRIPSFPAVTH